MSNGIERYNELAELPEGYAVNHVLLNNGKWYQLALFHNSTNLGSIYTAGNYAECRDAAIQGHGLLFARTMAWQHALDAALDDALRNFPKIGSATVASSTGNTSVMLYKLPLPSSPRLMAAEITITRGPITLKSHARDVSIGQIVAAICG